MPPTFTEKKTKQKKDELNDGIILNGRGTSTDNGHKKRKEKKRKSETVEVVKSDVDTAVKESEERSSEKSKKKKKLKNKDFLESDQMSAEKNGSVAIAKAVKQTKDKSGKNDNGKEKELIAEAIASTASQSPTVDGDVKAVQVSGRGSDDPNLAPVTKFTDSGLPEPFLKVFAGFQEPSTIQSHSWPVLRAGRDFIGIAATGSGKTLAFGVPAVLRVLANRKKGNRIQGPQCLVVAPTRELAQQIAEVLEGLGKVEGIKSVCIYGGAEKRGQRAALKSNPEIVVATPGRLLDFVEEGCCQLGNASYVVLDEADRMLDLGFEPAIRAILGGTSKERQTMMLSATWPPSVGQLASEFIRDPIKVTIGSEDLTANHDVTQIVEVIEDRARDSRLDALLRQYHKSRTNRVLVFVLYKKEAARVESMLNSRGWKCVAIHGDKGQTDRTRAVTDFKSGSVPLLIATDVAARGLDIPNVEFVINYSFPLTTEDYVHRIGRTGRAGKKGTAHTFFTQTDKPRAGELVNVLREAGQTVPADLLKFGTTVKKKESKLYGAHFRELTADAPKAKKTTFADSDDE